MATSSSSTGLAQVVVVTGSSGVLGCEVCSLLCESSAASSAAAPPSSSPSSSTRRAACLQPNAVFWILGIDRCGVGEYTTHCGDVGDRAFIKSVFAEIEGKQRSVGCGGVTCTPYIQVHV